MSICLFQKDCCTQAHDAAHSSHTRTHARRSSESSGVIRLLFRSLTGFSRQLDQLQQFSGEVTVRTLWSAVRDAFADDLAPDTEPQLALNRGDGTFELLSGAMDKVSAPALSGVRVALLGCGAARSRHAAPCTRAVAAQVMTEVDMVGPFMDVLVMYPSIRLLSARLLHTTLPSQPAALQALYNTRKKLTATQWHFYAVEHMLPSAYFIGHPGMGATLQTFYRKRKESDSGHMALAAEAETGGAWKVGQVRARHACRMPRPPRPSSRSDRIARQRSRRTCGSDCAGHSAQRRRPLAAAPRAHRQGPARAHVRDGRRHRARRGA